MPDRILKESITTSESIDELSWFEEVLFYRLITVCDDFGRYDARGKILKGKLFPLKDVTVSQINHAVDTLSSAGLIELYEVDSRPFLQMKKWQKYQRCRASKSKFPAPPERTFCGHLPTDDNKHFQTPTFVPDNDNDNDNDNEFDIGCAHTDVHEHVHEHVQNTARTSDCSDWMVFEQCWKLYPKKTGKQRVTEDAKRELEKVGATAAMAAVKAYAAEVRDRKPQYIKHGSTFFNGAWKDYVPSDTPMPNTAAPERDERWKRDGFGSREEYEAWLRSVTE